MAAKTKEKQYLHIYQSIRRDIESGLDPSGSKLPSKRTVARDFGVSVITAEHALQLLEDEGYVTARERSGCFVT
ncbi:MAG: winged helix-turn-helix transcriptional regulator, partial [Firmicutes bacterium]|nr:winged helix-turn-helix transcriptional regulator [Bacillota bacterium]